MTLRKSFDVMRRWRSLIVAGVLIGLVVGWVSAPGTLATTATFSATHTLIYTPQALGRGQIPAVALATVGAVPARVATRLGMDRRRVQSMVSAATGVGVLLITGRSADRVQAEALANFTAEELIIELGGPKAPLRTLEPGVASLVDEGDLQGPSSRGGRALLLGAFGLFLGVGAAFAAEQFDNRIRSKGIVEDALGRLVVAEVPPIPRSARDRLVSPANSPSFIEAYRGLRIMVDRWRTEKEGGDRQRLLVVTSPTGGEGKTTTVAHLAAALAEVGRSVLVISADLRRPRLHLYFDRPREPGLADVLRGAPDARGLTDLNLTTAIRGVRFLASGEPVENPGPLLIGAGDLLHDARSMGDFVLVDAPPLLATSDAADLARHADGVLLVVRAGRTSIGAATSSVELLERLGIPVIGVVLVSSDSSAFRLPAGRSTSAE